MKELKVIGNLARFYKFVVIAKRLLWTDENCI